MANNMEQVKRRGGRLSEKCCVGGKQARAKGSEGSEGWTEWERRREPRADLVLVV